VLKYYGLAAFASAQVGKGLGSMRLNAPAPGLSHVQSGVAETLARGNIKIYMSVFSALEAFDDNGVQGVRDLVNSDGAPPAMINAWETLSEGIDKDNQSQIWGGNKRLIEVEQGIIVQPIFQENSEAWKVVTQGVTLNVPSFSVAGDAGGMLLVSIPTTTQITVYDPTIENAVPGGEPFPAEPGDNFAMLLDRLPWQLNNQAEAFRTWSFSNSNMDPDEIINLELL
jgi:hypothetical protein